jgi:hypothetical protein
MPQCEVVFSSEAFKGQDMPAFPRKLSDMMSKAHDTVSQTEIKDFNDEVKYFVVRDGRVNQSDCTNPQGSGGGSYWIREND